MSPTEAFYLLPYIISLAISLGVFAYIWRHRAVSGASAFAWYTAGQSLWIAGSVVETIARDLQTKILWDKFEWLACVLIVIAMPVFASQFTEFEIRNPKRAFYLSLIVPLGFGLLTLTDNLHGLIYFAPRLENHLIFNELTYDFSPLVYFYSIYGLAIAAWCITIVLRRLVHPHQLYRKQIAAIVTGFAIPIIGIGLTLAGVQFAPQRDAAPLTLAIGNLLVAWGLYHYRLLDIAPPGRDKVFEAMVEPIVLLNNQHRVIDINSSMLDLLGKPAEEVIGRPAKEVFADFPIPIKLYTHVSYARAEASFQLGGRNVHYEMTVWPIYDSNRNMTGRIYISHDITALKELESELRDLNQRLEQRVHERTRELAEAYDTTLEGWAKALELRDKETEGHTRRVCDLTVRLARSLEIPEHEIVHIRRGAILHDIGKMAVPDEILRKKGRLTDEERAVIYEHPETARQFLSQVPFLQRAMDIPYSHHERWDGSGYPRGLKGREIPLAARIFAIVDVWDALAHERVYKKAWPRQQIVAYFKEETGRLFDPRLVDVFLKMVEKGEI